MRVAELCAGYGGLFQSLARAGWPVELSWLAEVDPDASKVLAAHHPDVPNIGDITAADFAAQEEVDVLAAGFPCQDVSSAGPRSGLIGDVTIPAGVMECGCPWADHQAATCTAEDANGGTPAWRYANDTPDDARRAVEWLNEQDREDDGPPPERVIKGTRTGVWTHVARAIDTLRPKIVFLENVRGLLSARAHSDLEPCPWCVGDKPDEPSLRALGGVLGDLADLGYDAVWQGVPAAAVGAPHLRWRVFILAFPAADAAGVGYGDAGLAGVGGVPSAAVGGGVAAGELSLLPTRRTSDTNGSGSHGSGGPDLRTVISLLPTPRARDVKGAETEATRASRIERGTAHAGHDLPTALTLLPTPAAGNFNDGEDLQNWQARRAAAAERHGNNGFGVPLGVAVRLLPTPATTDAKGARNATANRTAVKPSTNDAGWTLSDVAHAARWGEYAPAIARWEHAAGRPAPDPTEPGSKGQPRLSPRFVEWLMGLDDGYVTGVVGRNAALRILGNGVVPQQGALALSLLAPYLPVFLPEQVAA